MAPDRQMLSPPAPIGGAAPLVSPVTVALLAWGILAIAVVIKTLAAPGVHTVFPTFAESARDWWAGRPLYVHHDGLGAYRYSPAFAILVSPFAFLGLIVGGIAWTWANIAVFVCGLRHLARDVLPGAWPPERQAALLLLAMLGSLRGIWNGQSNALIVGLLMLGAAMLARRRFWVAGLALAISTFKVTPLVPVLLMGVVRRRLLLPLLVMLVATAILPWAMQSPHYVSEQYAAWFQHLGGSSARRWPGFRDAWTAWELLGGPILLPAYRVLQAAAGLAVLAWCWRQRRQRGETRTTLTLVLAMGVTYLMIFGPATESSTYAWLAPFAAWGLLESLERRLWRPVMVPAFLLTGLGTFGAVERTLGALLPGAQLMLPVGSALFALWLVLYGRSRHTED